MAAEASKYGYESCAAGAAIRSSEQYQMTKDLMFQTLDSDLSFGFGFRISTASLARGLGANRASRFRLTFRFVARTETQGSEHSSA